MVLADGGQLSGWFQRLRVEKKLEGGQRLEQGASLGLFHPSTRQIRGAVGVCCTWARIWTQLCSELQLFQLLPIASKTVFWSHDTHDDAIIDQSLNLFYSSGSWELPVSRNCCKVRGDKKHEPFSVWEDSCNQDDVDNDNNAYWAPIMCQALVCCFTRITSLRSHSYTWNWYYLHSIDEETQARREIIGNRKIVKRS